MRRKRQPEEPDIIDKLRDLHKQATEEQSHFYVASVALEAIKEIERLREDLQFEWEEKAEASI